MNLPSSIRSGLATGLLLASLGLSAPAKTPPYLRLKETPFFITPVRGAAATHSNGHVFVAGGYSSTGSAVTNLVQEFDLAKKTVTTAAPLPTARAGLGLAEFFVSAGNELFAIGGIDASGNVLGTVEIYNEATNTWSEGAAMPTPRAFLTVIGAPDGYIYAIGGTGASGKSVVTVEKYNPTNNTWSPGPSLNIARSHFGGVLGALDAIYVAGGIDVNGKYLSSSEAYSLILGGSFAVATSMNVARSDFAFDKGADGFLHAAGGHSATGDLRSIEGFNPDTGVWTIEPESFTVGQAELAGTEGINGRDYFIGGTTAKNFVPQVKRGIAPFAPSHTETFYMHGYDEPYINGTFAMDDEVPLSGETLGLSLLGTTSWTTFPSVTGTIQSGGTVMVNIPTTLSLGVLTTFTLYSQDFDGGSQVELGQVSQLIGLGLLDTVQIPISTPVTFNDKVLVLSISTVLGLDLNLSGGVVNMQVTGLDGVPSN